MTIGNAARIAQPGSVVLQAWRQQHGPEATRTALPAVAAVAPQRRTPARMVRRGYAAADTSNLTASFTADYQPLNLELERTLRLMVGRSRALAKNNDYVKKFLRMCQNHIVGPNGFALSVPCLSNSGAIDELDRAVVEKAFARWAKRGVCDVTRRLSFVQFCRLAVLHCARDGEVFVRRVKDRSRNPFGYALQMIDPLLVDYQYRADLGNGNRIRMGVEFDLWGAEVAYHIITDPEQSWGGGVRQRIDASEVWHFFLQEEAGQVRGVPWIHSAMRRLNDLGGYEEAAVIAARVGASNMGFFVPPADSSGNAGALADEVLNGKNANGDDQVELVRDATPGTFEELPPGYDFKNFNPDYPHQNFDSFVKAMLRGVASGTGADYNTLANDLEGVNYSSIRSGKLETQDGWMCLQGDFREWFLEPLAPEWLEMGFLSGQLAPLPVSKFEKYNVFVWQGRRWPWVDPLKDMEARKMEIEQMLNAPSDVMRELGRDPETVWARYEKDMERMDKIRKKFPGAFAKTPVQTPAPAGVVASGAGNKPAKEDDDDTDTDD
jgi:lambda family phage portal protein